MGLFDFVSDFFDDPVDFICENKGKIIGTVALGVLTGGTAYLAAPAIATTAGGLGLLGSTATTGTAISSLSGAALTNASLAACGGGALSAGGAGMAGGTAVIAGTGAAAGAGSAAGASALIDD